MKEDKSTIMDSNTHHAMWSAISEVTFSYSDPYKRFKDLQIELFKTNDGALYRLTLIDLVKCILGRISIPGLTVKLAKQNLANYGMQLTKDGFLFISTNNPLLEKLIKEKLSIITLKTYLLRLPGIVIAKHPRQLLGRSSRGVLIDLEDLLN